MVILDRGIDWASACLPASFLERLRLPRIAYQFQFPLASGLGRATWLRAFLKPLFQAVVAVKVARRGHCADPAKQ